MKALVFDKSKSDWETSTGFELADVPEPVIDEKNPPAGGPTDANYVIIKVHYAGVCGSDKGIWYRQAFREQILGSIDAENATPPPAAPPSLAGGDKTQNSPPFQGGVPAVGGGGGRKAYRIIGHEFFGEVKDKGSKVKNIKIGDFVTCESHVVCNQCYQCARGEKNVCTNEKILGISHDGGFAELAKVPSHIVWKTDTGKIRPEAAAMQEPFGNAVHAASKVDLKGKSVAVFGLGPIGMFLTLVIKGMGASSIIGIEPNPVAIEMAKKLGIDYVIPLRNYERNTKVRKSKFENNSPQPPLKLRGGEPGFPRTSFGGFGVKEGGVMKSYTHNPEVTDEIMKITNGVGVDVSFEMAGFNSSVNNCLYATRRGGDIILFGIKQGDFVFEDYNRLIVRGFTLHCVIGRQVWQTWETTRKLLEDPSNKVQEKMFNVILNEGKGTILKIEDYSKEIFEQMMQKHPKFLLQF